MICALVSTDNGSIMRRQAFDELPSLLAESKGGQWLELIEVKPQLAEGEIYGPCATEIDWDNRIVTLTYTAATQPIYVPQSVSPAQFRKALNAAGLRTQVEAAVAAADQDTKDVWEYATSIDRSNALLTAMAATLNIATEQLDGLFIAAGKL